MCDKILSVIIPVHNSSGTIKKCLESIMAQTYKNLEIIIVDDHSSDDSINICEKMQKYDSRIKIYRSNNNGASAARNLGIDKSSGDFLTFIDSDDYIDTFVYTKAMSVFLESDVKMVAYGIIFENSEGHRLATYGLSKDFFDSSTLAERIFNNRGLNGFVCNKIYSRGLVCGGRNEIRFDEKISIMEDNLFNYDIIFGNSLFKCACINDVYYHYVQHPTSVCNRKFNLQNLQYLVVRKKQIEMLKHNNMNADFLKIDYIVNLKKIKIKMKILKLPINDEIADLEKKGDKFSHEKLVATSRAESIKLFIVKYLPFVYEIYIRLRKENI